MRRVDRSSTGVVVVANARYQTEALYWVREGRLAPVYKQQSTFDYTRRSAATLDYTRFCGCSVGVGGLGCEIKILSF
jgi:hypothetical protein